MYAERRRSIRALKPLAIEYCTRGADKCTWSKGRLRDISDRGLCITAALFPAGKKTVRLRILIPGRPRRKLLLKGMVIPVRGARDDKTQVHIRFKRLSGSEKALLREYIAWILVNERGVR